MARKYNVRIEDAKREKPVEAYEEAIKECSENGETKEHRRWRRKNKGLMKRCQDLLEEFYRDREVEPQVRLQVFEGAEGGFRIHNGGDDYRPVKALSEDERKALLGKLAKYQKEMKEFTDFLRDKYFTPLESVGL